MYCESGIVKLKIFTMTIADHSVEKGGGELSRPFGSS